MQEHYDTRILISDVPKRNTLTFPVTSNVEELSTLGSTFNNSLFITDTSLDDFENRTLFENFTAMSNGLSQSEFWSTNQDFACTVKAVWKQNQNLGNRSEFKFFSFSGLRNFTTASGQNYVEACGLTLRTKYENGTYKDIPNFEDASAVTILSVNIFATSRTTAPIVIPSTLDNNLYPLNITYFTFDSFIENYQGNDLNIINMNLIKPVSNLVTFAFYKLPEKCNPDPDFLYHYSDESN